MDLAVVYTEFVEVFFGDTCYITTNYNMQRTQPWYLNTKFNGDPKHLPFLEYGHEDSHEGMGILANHLQSQNSVLVEQLNIKLDYSNEIWERAIS